MDAAPESGPFSYTVKVAEKNTGIPRTKLFKLMREGRISSAKIGKRRLILASSLHQYIEKEAAAA